MNLLNNTAYLNRLFKTILQTCFTIFVLFPFSLKAMVDGEFVLPKQYFQHSEGAVPFSSAVMITPLNSNSLTGACSGVMISPTRILTAAHCFLDPQVMKQKTPTSLGANIYPFGLPNNSMYFSSTANKREVREVSIHPDFIMKHDGVGVYLYADLALIQLKYALDIGSIKMLESNDHSTHSGQHLNVSVLSENLKLIIGEKLTLLGFGKSNITNSEALESGVYALQSREFKLKNIDDKTKTLRLEPGACVGDSGGPLLAKRNDKFYLVGILSASRAEGDMTIQEVKDCKADVIATDVRHFIKN